MPSHFNWECFCMSPDEWWVDDYLHSVTNEIEPCKCPWAMRRHRHCWRRWRRRLHFSGHFPNCVHTTPPNQNQCQFLLLGSFRVHNEFLINCNTLKFMQLRICFKFHARQIHSTCHMPCQRNSCAHRTQIVHVLVGACLKPKNTMKGVKNGKRFSFPSERS